MRINRLRRSHILKRIQKGSEGELTVGGPAAVNGMSPEILYLLDPAQGRCMLVGNVARSVLASCERRPGVARPLARSPARATHYVIKATSETLRFLTER